jgi:hypothetical protein
MERFVGIDEKVRLIAWNIDTGAQSTISSARAITMPLPKLVASTTVGVSSVLGPV